MIETHIWKGGYKTRGEHRTSRGEPGTLDQKNCSVSVGWYRTARGEPGIGFPSSPGWLFLRAFYLCTQKRENVGNPLV